MKKSERRGRRGSFPNRGMGSPKYSRKKQRDVSSKGGKAAHQKGTARKWTLEEARAAGRKGGLESQHRKREQRRNSMKPVTEVPRWDVPPPFCMLVAAWVAEGSTQPRPKPGLFFDVKID